jgi:uncharacterized membrane protein (UPF0127 family)
VKKHIIKNVTRNTPIITANLADGFFSKFMGLMFMKSIDSSSGIILAETFESILNTSIHMLFMNFDICAVWLSKELIVIDVKHAKRWRLAYIPKHPAKYVLETHISQLGNFSIGDQLTFN